MKVLILKAILGSNCETIYLSNQFILREGTFPFSDVDTQVMVKYILLNMKNGLIHKVDSTGIIKSIGKFGPKEKGRWKSIRLYMVFY